VPWVKSAQQKLECLGLPGPDDKIEMLHLSSAEMEKAGYQAIGIDHYALPADELAQAWNSGKLHRNFQGYCTAQSTGQVYALGASSISQLAGGYFQNHKDTAQYIGAIENGQLATARGYILSGADRIARAAINSIMCNRRLCFTELAAELGISKQAAIEATGFTPAKFAGLEADGLAQINGDTITVLPAGYFFTRNIAMLLDTKLVNTEKLYSKTL
jgi:oxygen-independent coproporphyrinogen III oxidase